MVTLLNPAVDVAPDGIVTACSWCTPRPRLDELARAYPEKVSHGLCVACAATLEAPRS
jgi:hypothetical protein